MKYGQSEFALTRATKQLWDNKPASFTYQPRDIEIFKDRRPEKDVPKVLRPVSVPKAYGKRRTKANAHFQRDRIMAVIEMNIN